MEDAERSRIAEDKDVSVRASDAITLIGALAYLELGLACLVRSCYVQPLTNAPFERV